MCLVFTSFVIFIYTSNCNFVMKSTKKPLLPNVTYTHCAIWCSKRCTPD